MEMCSSVWWESEPVPTHSNMVVDMSAFGHQHGIDDSQNDTPEYFAFTNGSYQYC